MNGTAEGKRDAGAHSPLVGHETSRDVLEKLSRGWHRDRVIPHNCPMVTAIPEGIRSAKRDKILPRQQLCLQQGLLVPEMEERKGQELAPKGRWAHSSSETSRRQAVRLGGSR